MGGEAIPIFYRNYILDILYFIEITFLDITFCNEDL